MVFLCKVKVTSTHDNNQVLFPASECIQASFPAERSVRKWLSTIEMPPSPSARKLLCLWILISSACVCKWHLSCCEWERMCVFMCSTLTTLWFSACLWALQREACGWICLCITSWYLGHFAILLFYFFHFTNFCFWYLQMVEGQWSTSGSFSIKAHSIGFIMVQTHLPEQTEVGYSCGLRMRPKNYVFKLSMLFFLFMKPNEALVFYDVGLYKYNWVELNLYSICPK